MIVPALIFLLFNPSGESHAVWGIPMATDIALAIGLLALLGSRAPIALKLFITTLAIADDLGAVLVIAIFYRSDISFINLAIGAGRSQSVVQRPVRCRWDVDGLSAQRHPRHGGRGAAGLRHPRRDAD
jgi:Na+/H+ antiporter NhaA